MPSAIVEKEMPTCPSVPERMLSEKTPPHLPALRLPADPASAGSPDGGCPGLGTVTELAEPKANHQTITQPMLLSFLNRDVIAGDPDFARTEVQSISIQVHRCHRWRRCTRTVRARLLRNRNRAERRRHRTAVYRRRL